MGKQFQYPSAVDHRTAKDMFKLWICSHQGRTDLVDQPSVGSGEIIIDAIERLELLEDRIGAVNGA